MIIIGGGRVGRQGGVQGGKGGHQGVDKGKKCWHWIFFVLASKIIQALESKPGSFNHVFHFTSKMLFAMGALLLALVLVALQNTCKKKPRFAQFETWTKETRSLQIMLTGEKPQVELQWYDITSVDIGWEMILRTLLKLVEKKLLNFFQNSWNFTIRPAAALLLY